MTTLGLAPEEWGGDTESSRSRPRPRTASTTCSRRCNVMAEVEELRANPDTEASGVVIESKLDPGRGPVVTMLVQRGTLKVGDALVCGANWGKVRALNDHTGAASSRPSPASRSRSSASTACRRPATRSASWRTTAPRARRERARPPGSRPSRSRAAPAARCRSRTSSAAPGRRTSRAHARPQGRRRRLARGRRGRDRQAAAGRGPGQRPPLRRRRDQRVRRQAGRRVRRDHHRLQRPARRRRQRVADREGMEIRTYSVIYKALDELRAAMPGMLAPEEVEETMGEIEVRQTFRASKIGAIAGSYVSEGKVTRGAGCASSATARSSTTAGWATLRRVNDDVREVRHGLRVRHHPRELPGHQGRRRPRGLRDASGRARALLAQPDVVRASSR